MDFNIARGLAEPSRTLAAAIVISSATTPTQAQTRESIGTHWQVADAMYRQNEEFTVRSGDIFLKHRLLPKAAARLESDLIDEKGNILVVRGAEMFSLESVSANIFCEAQQSKPNAAKSLLLGDSRFSHICGIDRDNYGHFEGYFTGRGLVKGLPSINSRMPKKVRVAKGGRFARIDPTSMSVYYFAGVGFFGKPQLGSDRHFGIKFGEGLRMETLSGWTRVSGGKYPTSVGLLGGKFTLLDEKDGVLRIRIDQPFPPQPFNVSVTVQFR